MAITASAQVYLGGEVGFWRNWDSNKTQFSITPEIGYNLDENWAIGTTIGYSYAYQGSLPVVGNQKMNAFIVEPYARYTFAKFDAVSLFLDGTVGFSTYKYSYEHGDDGDAQNQWEVGVKPGVKVDLTSKLSFIAHVGFLGYRDTNDDYAANGLRPFGDDGLEVDGRDGDERKEPPFAAYATDGFTAAVSTVPINTNAVNTAHKKALNFFKVIKGHSSESFFMSSGKA